MSTQDFKTILETLEKFRFSFTFGNDVTVPVIVNYNTGKSEGTFSIRLDAFDAKQRDQLLKLFDSTVKDKKFRVPKWAYEIKTPELKPKEKKPYTITAKKMYFSKRSLAILTDNIDLTIPDTITARIITIKELPDLVVIKHEPLEKDHPGIGVVHGGFVFSGSTDSWKAKPILDPVIELINSIKKLEAKKLKAIMDGTLQKFKENQSKRAKDISTTKDNAPAKVVSMKPVPVEPLTKQTVNKVYMNMLALIESREDNPDVFDSWEPSKIRKSWDGSNLVSIRFTVKGFVHQGDVAVTKDHKKGVYTVSLLTGKEPGQPKKVVKGVAGNDLCMVIDREIEFDCSPAEYAQRVAEKYPKEEEKKPAPVTKKKPGKEVKKKTGKTPIKMKGKKAA